MTYLDEAPCAFCAQILGLHEHNELSPLLEGQWGWRPVLLETAEAVVMPSIGALATGHVLVSPKHHRRSTAVCTPAEAASLNTLVDTTADHLRAEVGPVHLFEHGSSAACEDRVACSVEHAHVHLVPSQIDVVDTLASVADWRPYAGARDELLAATGGAEYLIYESPAGERLLATTRTGFASQLLRRVLAESMGNGHHWNWREEPAVQRIRATADLFTCAGSVATAATC